MLTAEGCLDRQRRFLERLASQKIDAAVLTDWRDIYYFTGRIIGEIFPHPACLFLDTRNPRGGWLVGPGSGAAHGVETLGYEPASQGTMHPDWGLRLTELVRKKLDGVRGIGRIGYEPESMSARLHQGVQAALSPREWVDVEPILIDMQRQKDADELALIREAIRIVTAAYEGNRKAIRPGVTELDVLQAGRAAALKAAGEKVFHDGDYQADSMGGWARNKPLEAGHTYVIDGWVMYRGYWADTSRTFSVDDRPTDDQRSVYEHVAAAHQKMPGMFKPGVRGTEICRVLDEYLRQHPLLRDSGLAHHAGHGTGLRVHMEPDLNPDREGVLREGDFVCFEPAGYVPSKHIYVRLENVYRVTRNGAESLVDYPFNLLRGA